MFTHTNDFYRAIALGIDAENQKASVYISHSGSIGNAREIILRDVMEEATPAPFKLATGLIHDRIGKDSRSSRQCDVLVYDPTTDPPKYAFKDFVVVDPGTARLVVEVKSCLDNVAFNHTLEVAKSVDQFSLPTLSFSYDSVGFDAFAEYFSKASSESYCHFPVCVAVHSKNYIAFRPTSFAPTHEQFMLLMNCGVVPGSYPGFSTATFLQVYDMCLRHSDKLLSEVFYKWFNTFSSLPDEARCFVASDGVVRRGAVPIESWDR